MFTIMADAVVLLWFLVVRQAIIVNFTGRLELYLSGTVPNSFSSTEATCIVTGLHMFVLWVPLTGSMLGA